jgi:hypothetical protein
MPGAQPRRSLESLIGSSVVRHAWTPRGVPGVYEVRRPRFRTPDTEAVLPWIQGPDYVLTLPLGSTDSWQYAVGMPEEDVGAATEVLSAALRDGIDLSDGPNLATGTGQASMIVQYDVVSGPTVAGVVFSSAMQASGGMLMSLANAEAAAAYTPPTPPSGFTLEYEDVAGTVVSDLLIEGNTAGGMTGAPTYGGSAFWTVEDNATFRTVAHMLSDYNLLLTWPEQATPTPFTETVPLDTSLGTTYADQEANTLTVHVAAEALTTPGTLEHDDDDLELRVSEAVIDDATVTVTVRPPRHRFVSAGSTWLASTDWNAYVWDAGLFLGTDWVDVTGLPTVTPTGCSQLNFYVAPAASDVFGDDQLEPYGRFYRNDDTSSGEIIAPDPGTPPDAGSHIWVIWFGPTSNVGVDPEPGVDPASLIPASLAENGTG